MIAMFCAKPDTVQLLFDARADPKQVCGTGMFDALDLAAFAGSNDNVKCWLKNLPGWDLDMAGHASHHAPVLFRAAAAPHGSSVVATLLEAQATVNSMGLFGGSPLFAAVFGGNLETVKVLLKYRVDVNRQMHPMCLKHRLACSLCRRLAACGFADHHPLIRILSNLEGLTALHIAA